MINHCSRHTTHFGELDISFVLLNISSNIFLHLECYLLPPKRIIKISKQLKQTKRYISITKKSDVYHSDLSRYFSDCTVLIGFTLPYFCACPKPRYIFPLFSIEFGMNQSSELVLLWYVHLKDYFLLVKWGSDGRYSMLWLNLQLMLSVPITTKALSYNIMSIKFVSDLWQVCGFLRFPPPIKLTATIN